MRTIGRRAARRILNGRDGGRGTEDLRALIATASAPTRPDHTHTERPQSAVPHAVLVAFREASAAPPATARRAVRGRSGAGALVLRFTAAILIVCGAGVAAASAGVLPAGVQRIAHDYLGVGSAPAPSTYAPSSSAVTSRTSTGGEPATSPPTSTYPTSAMAALCRKIPPTGSDWRADLSAADQATLIAAAGGDHKVKPYCVQLLAGSANGSDKNPNATASPEMTEAPSSTPSVKPTETHSNAHASRTPAARATVH